MNYYQGIDLLDIRRIEKIYDKFGDKLFRRILSKNELNFLCKNYTESKLIGKLANGFAVKEAAAKAIGIGFRKNVRFVDFELFYDSYNKPYLKIHKKIFNILKVNSLEDIHCYVSISNEKNFVIALVTMIVL